METGGSGTKRTNSAKRRFLAAIVVLSKMRLAAILVPAIIMLAIIILAAGKFMPGSNVTTDYSGEYDVSGIDMRIAVSKDHTYVVEEFISVDIPEPLESIAFALPSGTFMLEDLTVENKKARLVSKSGCDFVMISDPDLLTAGHHRYTIRYRIIEQADTDEGKDTFCFDVLPAGWEQPVSKLHALLWFPYGFPLEEIRPYAAESPDADESPETAEPTDIAESPDTKVTIKIEPQSRSFTLGVRRIPEDHPIRLEAPLPDGYWER